MNLDKWRSIAYEEFFNIEQYRSHNHVSIITRDNRILGIGINRRKTHPLAATYVYRFGELHSELDALIKIPKNQRYNMTLINFRFGPKGNMKLSKPCTKCLPWCCSLFEDIWYSIPDGLVKMEYDKATSNPLH